MSKDLIIGTFKTVVDDLESWVSLIPFLER